MRTNVAATVLWGRTLPAQVGPEAGGCPSPSWAEGSPRNQFSEPQIGPMMHPLFNAKEGQIREWKFTQATMS